MSYEPEYPGDTENAAYVRRLLSDKDPDFCAWITGEILAELADS